MLKTITRIIFSLLLFTSLAVAQWQPVKITSVTGEEKGNANTDEIGTPIVLPNQEIDGVQFTWDMHQISDLMSGYDLQSNSSTQQLWIDPINGTLNAVFTTSQETSGWTDRTCTYFYSMDGGVNWTNVANVPPPAASGGAHSGFPAINGLSTGSVVITNHSALGGGVSRAQLFINTAPGEDDFANFDPGPAPDNTGSAIWPRLTVTNDDNIVMATSINLTAAPFYSYTNVFNTNTGLWSGYQWYDGANAETHALAVADNGTVGHFYIGNFGEAFFRESTDGGVTWGDSVDVFIPYLVEGDTNYWGAIRGLDLTYLGDSPAAVLEIMVQTPDFQSYFPAAASQILYWNPDVTGDTLFVVADSNNVPYYPNNPNGTADVMNSLARPTIGKAAGDPNHLFIAFQSTTENRATTLDSTTFYAGWFTMSTDMGATWSAPEKFTPETPILDWDWASIGEVNPVNESGDTCTVHIVMQADPTPGSQVNGSPAGVTAMFYHFSTTVPVSKTGVDDDNNFVNSFDLGQNYPNPFNPTTSIKYTLAERSNVVLKVFDVLGNEVATLVNQEKGEGPHEVTFNASNLASGLYVYTIQAGSFQSSKKMMLLK